MVVSAISKRTGLSVLFDEKEGVKGVSPYRLSVISPSVMRVLPLTSSVPLMYWLNA